MLNIGFAIAIGLAGWLAVDFVTGLISAGLVFGGLKLARFAFRDY